MMKTIEGSRWGVGMHKSTVLLLQKLKDLVETRFLSDASYRYRWYVSQLAQMSKRERDEVEFEITLLGLNTALSRLKPSEPARRRSEAIIEKQRTSALAANAQRREKIKLFDRIVEMLDHTMVGNKPLGDCTKADLLRAAVAAEQSAGELTIQAAFYRQLAAIIGPVGTVREHNDRAGVVALLTTTFKTEEADE